MVGVQIKVKKLAISSTKNSNSDYATKAELEGEACRYPVMKSRRQDKHTQTRVLLLYFRREERVRNWMTCSPSGSRGVVA